ncbi:MAG TPA: hypothetical protein VJR92_03860 [Gemmatimonadaceae bacterium]|nr:hypothetical protein [Gemmatimonadaceae bacterium]
MANKNVIGADENPNNVKAIRLAQPAMAANPGPGGPDQLPLFAPVDRLNGGAEGFAGPGFHLNERNSAFPFGDEVEVAMSIAKSALNDAPAFSFEPFLRDALAAETE